MESENESPPPPTTPRKKAKLLKAQQKYKHEWEYQYDWLTSDPVCEFNAKCKICALTFTISHAGVGQLGTEIEHSDDGWESQIDAEPPDQLEESLTSGTNEHDLEVSSDEENEENTPTKKQDYALIITEGKTASLIPTENIELPLNHIFLQTPDKDLPSTSSSEHTGTGSVDDSEPHSSNGSEDDDDDGEKESEIQDIAQSLSEDQLSTQQENTQPETHQSLYTIKRKHQMLVADENTQMEVMLSVIEHPKLSLRKRTSLMQQTADIPLEVNEQPEQTELLAPLDGDVPAEYQTPAPGGNDEDFGDEETNPAEAVPLVPYPQLELDYDSADEGVFHLPEDVYEEVPLEAFENAGQEV
ncbi:hypothetical protein RN001_005946 [Aquatica leii]|uniref:Uncharacterized protein n=1 Tax=Aquatica leii TaxID=1421715 RepID=A0AAN7PCH4_9COLE|nr:hypothetical protein RN001_005946 [Aquatica leii]